MDYLKTADLFRIIQSFSSRKDYLALMNVNISKFGWIKRETVKYFLKMSNVDEIKMIDLSKLLTDIGEKVNNPSRQVSLEIYGIRIAAMEMIPMVASKLHTLHIDYSSSYLGRDSRSRVNECTNFDFSVLNNIPRVVLTGFPHITEITNELQNIQHLSLSIRSLQDVRLFNLSNSLSSFHICCYHHNIQELPIQTNFNEHYILLMKGKWIDTVRLGFEYALYCPQKENSRFLSLVLLKIRGSLSLCPLALESLMDVELLELDNVLPISLAEDSFEFPNRFQGKQLTIHWCSIFPWTSETKFNSIEYLELNHCFGIEDLPEMPKLRFLSLNNVSKLSRIRTFPRCTHIKLLSLPSFIDIEPQPKARFLDLDACTIHNHSFDGQIFRSVSIIKSFFLINLFHWTRNTHRLEIVNTRFVSIKAFEGYNNTDILSENKECSLNTSRGNIDLSSLSNLRKVSIISSITFGTNEDPTRLSNIFDLSIRRCSNYITTHNLLNIRQRLCIEQCEKLTILVGLQGIPEVALCNLPSLLTITGLGYHNHVYVYKVPFLEEQAKLYVAQKNSRESYKPGKLPFAYLFDTIKSFTILSVGSDWNGYCFKWDVCHTYEQEKLW